MRGRWMVGALMAVGVGCATGGKQGGSTAQVTLATLTPAAASALDRSSVIDATVDYTIQKFQAERDRYYLTIQFEDAAGRGSFNHYHRFSEEPMLSAAQGSVHITYAMSQVWDDSRLKKPIRIWFLVVERTAAHDSSVIGRVGPIEYAAK
jgi:hypothetical protein